MLVNEFLQASQGLDGKRQVVWKNEKEQYQALTRLQSQSQGYQLITSEDGGITLNDLRIKLQALSKDEHLFLPDERPLLGYQIFHPTIICLN
ncbi:signal transduction histidine kinase [Ligilactobacillus equi]|uniref:Putative CheA signal transduction histidine kinase n=1 Tax=Ligilactobacillus equi DPC 6820 TaxID=1392007 RepID=V7HZ12_9LACO|nr:signal transduction histidine kinase [Ligilactobacillus equi]ETA75127.1 putative CheA signal transduction histidine kinase [Ligilactobacillus equi DPC 6820]